MAILVTGGAGFVGSNLVFDWIAGLVEPVVSLDKLTCADNFETLTSLQGNPRPIFVQGGISVSTQLESLYTNDLLGDSRRYDIDKWTLEAELGWNHAETFGIGIFKTVHWYLDHPVPVPKVQSGACRKLVSKQYEESVA